MKFLIRRTSSLRRRGSAEINCQQNKPHTSSFIFSEYSLESSPLSLSEDENIMNLSGPVWGRLASWPLLYLIFRVSPLLSLEREPNWSPTFLLTHPTTSQHDGQLEVRSFPAVRTLSSYGDVFSLNMNDQVKSLQFQLNGLFDIETWISSKLYNCSIQTQ